ncbi:MAG TPA: hypothetical protein ENG69_02995 [Candidatus Korarchaeota archaeon]|nr:hypothetical protein [Candidatus Korarchaeota archaeon]
MSRLSEGRTEEIPLAVVDNEILALGFEMVGVRARVIRGRKSLLEFFREHERSLPHVVFVNERVFEEIESYRTDLLRKGKLKPVFAVVPDLEKPRGVRLRQLRELLLRALGTEELKI